MQDGGRWGDAGEGPGGVVHRYRLFVRGLATNWIGTAGVALTTSAAVLFVFMELLRVGGIVTNAYVGLISYLLLPALFLLGLALIPLGWQRYRRASGRTTAELLDRRFTPELTARAGHLGSPLAGLILLLTLANLLVLGIGGARMLHFMDEPSFCGTACHRVMHPEWITYQRSPHARVACVECHVGEGAEALIDAKLNGLWQVVSATLDLYERPIPTPVRNLRPARETCEKCHWPEMFYGERLEVRPRYALDEISQPSYTTLALKVGSGRGERRGTIHWHVAPHNQVRYLAADEERLEMRWVEVDTPEGGVRRYERAGGAEGGASRAGDPAEPRVLDCVDCHNRVTHIYEDPERAVDAHIAAGRIDRRLPFAKREALGALLDGRDGGEAALAAVERRFRGFYAWDRPEAAAGLQEPIDAAVAALQASCRRNLHPRMRVGWNPYPDHRGHAGVGGCPRCHQPDLVDREGRAIPYGCTLCHSILAYESPEPFQFLFPVSEEDAERDMHLHLQQEFLRGRR